MKTIFRYRERAINSGLDGISTKALGFCLALFCLGLRPTLAWGQNAYVIHNLVSDLPGVADVTDTNLVNPWGIAFSSSSLFWISDNHSGLSTLYNTSGRASYLIVNIPPPIAGT